MQIRLHRCRLPFLHTDLHACSKVQKALDVQGIPYAVVRGPLLRRNRHQLVELGCTPDYPVIEFDDGKAYREDADAMVARIAAGTLLDGVRYSARWPKRVA